MTVRAKVTDPIFGLGREPVFCNTPNASTEHDRFLYGSQSETRLPEIVELMNVQPLTGAEIVQAGLTGTWADEGIADGGAWVEEKRRERRTRRSW